MSLWGPWLHCTLGLLWWVFPNKVHRLKLWHHLARLGSCARPCLFADCHGFPASPWLFFNTCYIVQVGSDVLVSIVACIHVQMSFIQYLYHIYQIYHLSHLVSISIPSDIPTHDIYTSGPTTRFLQGKWHPRLHQSIPKWSIPNPSADSVGWTAKSWRWPGSFTHFSG